MQTSSMRERMFTMRLSDEESARLESVAAHYGLNAAGVLRMLVKREADALAAAAEKKTKKTAK